MIKPTFDFEKSLWKRGIKRVIGIDEVGRGAFAGPIVAAGVVFSPDIKPKLLDGVNDSKLLTPARRLHYSEIIKQNSIYWTIEEIGVSYINKHGIGKANSEVFRKVIKNLLGQINEDYFVLIDGFHRKYLPGGLKKQKGIIKGDSISLSIASASIIAKVYRDNLMENLDEKYQAYGFADNKGYGTLFHRNAIDKFGTCDLHRKAFLSKYL